ncbi:MAG TPA: hypothetical protein VFW52_00090 [Candidatus Saccharimonadales bacterium]|nr:hypothetical protein [Candidatus Saccharimonadales bacterium]
MSSAESLDNYENPIGEDFGEDLARPVARHANSRLKLAGGENTVIDLGDGYGEHGTKDVRFRDSSKPGYLTAYIRTKEIASEHKATTITASAIAIGAVIAGIYALKHRQR